MEVSIALVETARNGYMWEVLAYDKNGNEVGGRFDTEQKAINCANKLKETL